MKTLFATLSAIAITLKLFAADTASDGFIENFDAGWKFLPADASGAERPDFNDAQWQAVNVPHDWAIAGPFAETNLTGGAGAFLPSGVGWYRKEFTLPEEAFHKCIAIQFDGVMQNSDVWINGFHLGQRPNGYVSFSYELANSVLNFGPGTANVLAVRCDTSAQPASRWYAGAGIYRHVRMEMTEPVHIVENGIFVSASHVSPTNATVRVEIAVTNATSLEQVANVQVSLLSPEGKLSGSARANVDLPPHASQSVVQELSVRDPHLWDLENPQQYQVSVRFRSDEKLFDVRTINFGIRDAHFEAETGFWLNGKNFKIKGVCLHEDGGALGMAVPLSVWESRLKTLKSLGVNAVRTAHSPPAPGFLDLCDRLGLLVMDEMFDCWAVGKNPFDYHLYFDTWSHRDERDAILRDRNHPSVILYSLGNEIHDTPQAAKAKRILAGLVAVAHEADPTRPVTQALFRPNVSHDYDDGLADLLDVVGQNYRENEILAAHEQKPSRKIIGTENTHDRKQWLAMRDHAPYAGQFLWTGIDYLGEARRWPVIGHGSGLLDRTGAIRPLGRERESWWSDQPMVAITRRVAATDLMPDDPGYGGEERHTQVLFSDWTPENVSSHLENVEVYSNAKEVELFLNGQSLGAKNINADASPRNWRVSFAPGILKAVARNDGKVVATDELRTAGKPAKIILVTEAKTLTSGFEAVAGVRAKITDANGLEIPRARDLISFQVSGPGKIVAVDNGDNSSHESFQAVQRHAFQGECIAFIAATAGPGKIVVKATAPGLADGLVEIEAGKISE